MNIVRKSLSALGIIFLAALLIASLAPRAARGVAAALVQVTNTSANPVPNLDVNTPAEEPFETILCIAVGTFAGACSSNEPQDFVVPTTTTDGATVKRLVIENLSGDCVTGPTTQVLAMGINTSISENTVNGSSVGLALVPASGGAVFGQATRLYADPGSLVFLEPFVGGSGSTNLICDAAVNGYLITK